MRFAEVAAVWSDVEAASGRLEMAGHLAKLLAQVKKDEVKALTNLCQGILAPPYEGLELGLGEKLAEQAISIVSGRSAKELETHFNKSGDWGAVAEWALGKKKQMSLSAEELELNGVYASLVKLAKLSGSGSQEGKIKTLAELLNSASPLEAKYIVRFCVGKLRLGVQEPTILDALALLRVPKVKDKIAGFAPAPGGKRVPVEPKWNYEPEGKKEKELSTADSDASLEFVFTCIDTKSMESASFEDGAKIEIVLEGLAPLRDITVTKIRPVKDRADYYRAVLMGFKKSVRAPLERAFNLSSDLAHVAELALFDYAKVEKFQIRLFSPVRPALAERLSAPADILEKIGPCAAEGKYDGFRLQVHKDGERVELYSRKLEKVTHAFPEVVEAARKLPAKHLIFEGEALAYSKKEKRYYSFQTTIQRKRKHGVAQMAEELPLHLFAFDLLYLDGVDWAVQPYESRRAALEKLVAGQERIEASSIKQVKSGPELENFFEHCLKEGLEGIIAKDPSAPYTAGARDWAWIKLKKSYGALADTLDVVIVGYYRGEGARTGFGFGGLLVAVRNEQSGNLQTVARVGSGFTEEEMVELEKTLSAIKRKTKPAELESSIEPDFWVEPKYVCTVSADEISLSPQHTAGQANGKGYALRFPRLMQMREDKGPEQCTTVAEVERIYSLQKNRGK
ncbi:DNA ligase [uncultured archaeon]|nr:DNA ligase [uncultured archaeon]